MSNPERGAYSPPTEEPLTFDARRPVRGRTPLPMMLIFSSGILFVLIVGGAVIVHSGVGRESDTPPLVGKSVDSMKAAPPPEAQPEDPAEGLQIYQQAEGQAQPGAPNFAPPPEQPQPRSEIVPAPVEAQPTAPLVAMPTTPPPPAFKPAVAASAPTTRPVQQKPAPVIVLTQPKPAPAKRIVEAAKPKPAAVAVKPAPDAPSKTETAKVEELKPAVGTATAGAASVQIGAFSSQALADKGWNDAVKIAPGPAAGKGKKVQAVDKDGATLYRTTVTGFASRDAAAAFCNQLKAAGKNCFVK